MKVFKLMLVAAIAVLIPAIVWAAPGAGIAGTDHDFSGTGGTQQDPTPIGLCTFCHTPHRALQTLLLWNHTLSTSTFSWDVTKTTAGTDFPTFKGDTYKGPTAKCLSCHDGTVAVGDINWWLGGTPTPLDNTKHVWPDKHNVGATGGIAGSMKGNHPVAMPYPYGGLKNTYNGVTTGGEIVFGEWQNPPPSPIRMFNDDGTGNISAGLVGGKSGIECSSCHDPHNKASVDDYFLRGELKGNTTAYICLKCHIK